MRRHHRLQIGICLLLASTVTVFAQSPTQGPGWKEVTCDNIVLKAQVAGLSDQQVVSGTNVNARFVAGVSSLPFEQFPDPWIHVEITSIEGCVGSSTIPRPPSVRPPYSYGVTFQSNHFSHNQEVGLTAKVAFHLASLWGREADITVETSDPLIVKVYNIGSAFGASDIEGSQNESYHGVHAAAEAMRAMKHFTNESSDISNSVFEAAIGYSTALHMGTHGTSWPSILSPMRESYTATELRGIIMGYSGKTPYNLVFMCACNTANKDTSTNGSVPYDGTLNHGFSTYSFLYEAQALGACINRAQLGFTFYVPLKWYRELSEVFWGAIAQGLTANQARDAAMQAIFRRDDWQEDGDFGDLEYSQDPKDFLVCFGDFSTRLGSVYTGDESAPVGWYKAQP